MKLCMPALKKNGETLPKTKPLSRQPRPIISEKDFQGQAAPSTRFKASPTDGHNKEQQTTSKSTSFLNGPTPMNASSYLANNSNTLMLGTGEITAKNKSIMDRIVDFAAEPQRFSV